MEHFNKSAQLSIPLDQHTISIEDINNFLSTQKTCQEMADKILQMNASAFCELRIPIDTKNLMTFCFESLCRAIKVDLASSKNPKEYKIKLKIYLDVADKLLSRSTMKDFHGAAAIAMALRSRPTEIKGKQIKLSGDQEKKLNALLELYNINNNYKNLRDAMLKNHPNCIPFLLVYNQYFERTLVNDVLFYKITVYGKICQELSEKIFHIVDQKDLMLSDDKAPKKSRRNQRQSLPSKAPAPAETKSNSAPNFGSPNNFFPNKNIHKLKRSNSCPDLKTPRKKSALQPK